MWSDYQIQKRHRFRGANPMTAPPAAAPMQAATNGFQWDAIP